MSGTLAISQSATFGDAGGCAHDVAKEQMQNMLEFF